ncbi:RNase III inhibitor [Sedimentisphaera cyanobacteriorum]|uniref:RNase III inhibitor n=1 Tax=Sedimentisphaera cyanobacteriorum TaxID=1940790 RepID=A0A1Q2HRG9_9BACT|nr:macro domain-containing protein [Sedimentisphaera cyanobacteriorum]AQQ09931.1 RNase III inhibitor [Sedimentisphaera cyanobacteriorum]
MIKTTKGDILKADTQAIVNTVNCVGVMGRGIALQFRKTFPENFKSYKSACEKNKIKPGKMFTFSLNSFSNPKYIINFPTKRHWKGKSRLEDIESGLKSLALEVRQLKIGSVALPPLGCGLGGLSWAEVRPMIEKTFSSLPEVEVLLYEPAGAPQAKAMAKKRKCPEMTAGRAALIGLMDNYLKGFIDPFVSLLEIHKLMYFMQFSGENLRLRYAKGKYGPYAENLRHVLNEIEGYFIEGYADAGDNPDKQIELIPNAVKQAESFLKGHKNTLARFEKVVDLIQGFETPYGMELLSTVHWAAEKENAKNIEQVVEKTYAWNERKKMFKKEHIKLAYEVLKDKGWVEGCC